MGRVHVTIARHPFDLDRAEVERTMREVRPDPLRSHYVIVNGRRYPPKQVIATVTGLDRSDFITTQARNVLERLGFRSGRVKAHVPAQAGGRRQAGRDRGPAQA